MTEFIKQHRVLAAGFIVLLTALALVSRRSNDGPVSGGNSKAFFTVDDGTTWFADDIHKVPPFTRDGKVAYRCYVYTGADSKPFVSHLERYTDEAKTVLEQVNASGKPPTADQQRILFTGVQVKRPGLPDTAWVSKGDRRAVNITAPTALAGSAGQPVPLEP